MKQEFWRSALALAVLAGVAAGAHSQTQNRASTPKPAPIGLPQDWSSSSNLFVAPITPDEAAAVGPARATYVNRLAQDPRYILALANRFDAEAASPVKSGQRTVSDRRRGHGGEDPATPAYDDHRDWSNVLGGTTGGNGSAGTFPAKYNFNVAADPDCVSDYVAYTTGTAGATATGTNSTRTSNTYPNSNTAFTVTVGAGARLVTLTGSSASPNSGTTFQTTATGTTNAVNLAAAIARWAGVTGVTASANAGVVTVTANSPNSTITLTENMGGGASGFNWNNQPVLSGTRGQPTIVAFNNLYKGTCGAANAWYAPNTYWAYNTGTGRIAETSPILSYYPVGATPSGGQVAFVQRRTDTNPDRLELVLLKWATGLGNGSVGAPAAPSSVIPADYRTCTAPCMTVIEFNGTSNTDGAVTHSAPFMDYTADVLWVGDGAGKLRRFANVFRSGTPAETVGGGFPVTVIAGNSNKLSPPVYDFAGNVWIGSASQAGGVGGRLHKISAVNGAILASTAKLTADGDNPGLRAWPQVDRSGGRAYVYVHNDGSTACPRLDVDAPCQAVVQLPTDTVALNGSSGNKAIVGRSFTSNTTVSLYAGAFDNALLSSPARNGNLYVCGSAMRDSRIKMMWSIPVTGGVLGTPSHGIELTSATDGMTCSPVKQVKNGTNEYFYASVPLNTTTPGCTGACLYSFQAATSARETWTFQFTGANGNTDGAGTIVINGISLDPNTNTTGDNFDASGSAQTDAFNLAEKINAFVPGFTADARGTTVAIVSTTAGDFTITEGVSNFGQVTNANATFALQQPKNALPVFGGTGGLVIDNFGALPGTSQVYFSHLATPGNAVQVSQSNLD